MTENTVSEPDDFEKKALRHLRDRLVTERDRAITYAEKLQDDSKYAMHSEACYDLMAERDTLRAQVASYEGPGYDYEMKKLEARVSSLTAALEAALHELGVPDENYPAPVANAVECLSAALSSITTPQEEEPETAGLRPHRLPRPTLFMEIAHLFGRRSSCPRAAVGCIAVLEGRIVATGYVGAPHGQAHCIDVGCQLVDGHCVRTIHAESNLIAWAARTGTPLLGTTVWCTHSPCLRCAQLMVNAGITGLVWDHIYTNQGATAAMVLLKDMGVNVVKYEPKR